jgi:hypothetical protein
VGRGEGVERGGAGAGERGDGVAAGEEVLNQREAEPTRAAGDQSDGRHIPTVDLVRRQEVYMRSLFGQTSDGLIIPCITDLHCRCSGTWMKIPLEIWLTSLNTGSALTRSMRYLHRQNGRTDFLDD